MRAINDSRLSAPLRRAAERFAAWRRSYELGTRIPNSLWVLATNLASTYGLSRTASTLKLDYYALKRRVEERTSPATQSPRSSTAPAFLELPAATLAGSGECVIEFENVAGAKMRVHVKGMAAPDLVSLSRSFWSAE